MRMWKTIRRPKILFLSSLTVYAVSLFVFGSGTASALTSNRLMVMSLDGSDTQTTVYSVDQTYSSGGGYYSGWLKQISAASNPYVVKIGGERIVALLNNGTLLTKDSLYANWVTQTTGVLWVDVGANGEMMLINSAGNAYSKVGLYDPWVQQTSGGGTIDVAVGGNGRLMVIDSAGNAYSKDSTYDSWIKQVDGASEIYLGAGGQMGVINSAGNAYTKMNRYDPWVQQTSGGGTKMMAIGGNGRLMVIDSASNAYSKESTYDAWIMQVAGAIRVAVGSSGRLVVIDSNYEVYYKDAPTLDWNLVYRSNYPTKNYSYWLYIN